MGKHRELDVEQRAFADVANHRGHAFSGVNVAAGLRTVVVFEDMDGMTDCGRQRGEFGVDFEIAQSFADFFDAGDFFQAD